jgi:hypothetical protein
VNAAALEAVPRRRVCWPRAWLALPAAHARAVPDAGVAPFARLAAPADFEALGRLEAMTAPLPEEAQAQAAHAACAHADDADDADDVQGVLCAALQRDTAVDQFCRRHARFLRSTGEGPMYVGVRLYRASIDAELHDLGVAEPSPAGPDADGFPVQWQGLAARLRAAGSVGIVWRSGAVVPRRAAAAAPSEDRQCVALFGPQAVQRCRPAAGLLCAWDGQRFTSVFQRCA